MKAVKWIDVIIQSLIILGSIVFLFIKPGAALLLFLIGLGFFQILSALIHIPYFVANRSKLRKQYYWGLLGIAISWAAVSGLNALFTEPFFEELTIGWVVVSSVIMGLLYYFVSITELKTLLSIREQQNLVDLGH